MKNQKKSSQINKYCKCIYQISKSAKQNNAEQPKND